MRQDKQGRGPRAGVFQDGINWHDVWQGWLRAAGRWTHAASHRAEPACEKCGSTLIRTREGGAIWTWFAHRCLVCDHRWATPDLRYWNRNGEKRR